MKFSNGVGLRSAGLLTITAALALASWMEQVLGAGPQPPQRGGSVARDASDSSAEQQHFKLREGTTLEATGYFKITGERAIFTAEDGARYSGLENQNLERVAIATSESPDPLLWSVTGTVTEFRGANYLLITRVMLKTKASPLPKSAGAETAKPRLRPPAAKP